LGGPSLDNYRIFRYWIFRFNCLAGLDGRRRPVWVRPEKYKVVGECLARARRQAKLTQADLAKRLRKPQSFISSYERGQRRVDLLEFLLITDALRADPLEVFGTIVAQRRKR
jgi:hypothetical protein